MARRVLDDRRAVPGRAVRLPGAGARLKPHDGRYPVLGSWVVNGVACGMGIREDDSLVTRNTSRFVPHQMVG